MEIFFSSRKPSFAGEKHRERLSSKLKCFLVRSVLNQCWRVKNFLTTEEDFKFLLYEEDGFRWLAHTDKEILDLVENVTKSKGFYEDETFLTPATISIECLGNNKWKFLDDYIPG